MPQIPKPFLDALGLGFIADDLYRHVKERMQGNLIISAFASSDPSDLVKKFGGKDETGAKLRERLVQSRKEKGQTGVVSMFFVPMFGFNESKIEKCDDDVLYMGEIYEMGIAFEALQLGARLYLLRYADQIIKRVGLDGLEQELFSDKPRTYDKITNMGNYITTQFVGRMIDAARMHDSARFDVLRKDFVRFAAGAPFINAVLSLCDVIQRDSDNFPLNLYSNL